MWNNQNARQNWLSNGLAGDTRRLKDRSWGQVLARFGQFADQGHTPALVQAPGFTETTHGNGSCLAPGIPFERRWHEQSAIPCQ